MKISDELKKRIENKRVELAEEERKLIIQEAIKNAPYKIGDIIEDHYHIIKIDKIKVLVSTESLRYYFEYRGVQLNKKLTPTKRQNNTVMYERNVESKLN